MQSFHTKIIILLLYVYINANLQTTISLILTDLFAPVNHFIAAGLQLSNHFVGLVFLMSIFLTLLVKYLSIYNGPFVANLDETFVIPLIKCFLFALSIFLCILDYGILCRIEENATYQFLR